ncbi:MAG: hypothetical protein DLM73_14250 [Chthoniobacterales bacterium]|nr:MAG: hypothetical protein DLM73_14250 [Chthoniobacterales bacterium]
MTSDLQPPTSELRSSRRSSSVGGSLLLLSTLAFLLSTFAAPTARAVNLRGEEMASFDFSDRFSSSDFILQPSSSFFSDSADFILHPSSSSSLSLRADGFILSPTWLVNALPGGMGPYRFYRPLIGYDRAGDPVSAQRPDIVSSGYTPFDVGLFNVAGFASGSGSGASKTSTPLIASLVTDSSWIGTGTISSPTSGAWDVATEWSPNGTPPSVDNTVLRFGGSGTSSYASTNDLGDNDGFIFGSIFLNSSASVTEVINGENFNGRLAVGQFGSTIRQDGSGAFNFFNQINSKNFGAGVLSSTTLNLVGDGTGVVTLLGEINDRAGQITAQSQNLGVLKEGSSTFILTGTNTYSRGTTVNGGTLLINNAFGSGTGSGTVIVNNGGTLGGDGTVSVTAPLNPLDRLVTINDGGTVAPGAAANTVGALTLNATRVVFNAGSTFLVDLSGTLSDVLHTSGVLDLSALSNNIITFAGSVAAGTNTYTLATYDGVAGIFEVQNNLPSGYELIYGPTSLLLTNDLTVIPEPSTWIGAAIALVAIGFIQRRLFSRMINELIVGLFTNWRC